MYLDTEPTELEQSYAWMSKVVAFFYLSFVMLKVFCVAMVYYRDNPWIQHWVSWRLYSI